ncbi:TPA: hypothetical protein ACGHLA_000621 [Salmonella enterica subsp. enterica serovar Bovismorbificans]
MSLALLLSGVVRNPGCYPVTRSAIDCNGGRWLFEAQLVDGEW